MKSMGQRFMIYKFAGQCIIFKTQNLIHRVFLVP